MLKGGCYCGAIRYEAEGPPSLETNCHCADCRGVTGAPFVAWFTVPASGFRWIAGEPIHFQSSDRATRSFCGRCGTALMFRSKKSPGEVDITTCSLDDPEAVPPKSHTWTRSRLSWIRLADRLPAYPTSRSE